MKEFIVHTIIMLALLQMPDAMQMFSVAYVQYSYTRMLSEKTYNTHTLECFPIKSPQERNTVHHIKPRRMRSCYPRIIMPKVNFTH